MKDSRGAPYEESSERMWTTLHAQPRFRPRYPSEQLVRFLVRMFPSDRERMKALDIGTGGGRHTKLLCELGFETCGIDLSPEGLRHTAEWLANAGLNAKLEQASMMKLPFGDGMFDLAIAFGVYCYADRPGMRQAIGEMWRVLRWGGSGFVHLRTTDDYRFGKGRALGENSFVLDIADTNEQGSVMTFVAEGEVAGLFAAFTELTFERTETTFNQRRGKDSDWLIHARK